MYTSMTHVTAKFQFSASSSQSSASSGTDAFAAMLEQMKNSSAASQSTQSSSSSSSVLDLLSQRFPSLSFKEGASAEGATGAQEVFGNEEGSHVAIETAAAQAMSTNSTLADMIERALSAFSEMSGQISGQTSGIQGAYSQTSISISITSVSMNMSNYDNTSGELLTASDLQTSLSEKIDDMIRKFFGKGPVKSAESAETVADETETTEETENSTNETAADETADSATTPEKFDFKKWLAGGTSMSMYYSASYISSLGSSSTTSESSGSESASLTSSMAFAGNFQSFVTQDLPNAFFSGLQSSGFGSGPFTSMLNSGLEQLGLSTESMWQEEGGYFMKLRESNSLISELMNYYNGSRPAVTGEEPAQETEAGVVDEELIAVP